MLKRKLDKTITLVINTRIVIVKNTFYFPERGSMEGQKRSVYFYVHLYVLNIRSQAMSVFHYRNQRFSTSVVCCQATTQSRMANRTQFARSVHRYQAQHRLDFSAIFIYQLPQPWSARCQAASAVGASQLEAGIQPPGMTSNFIIPQ